MYEPKTRPFDHQRRALEASRVRPGFAYLMEMGTGKTKVMIDEIGELHSAGAIESAVIFCPKGVTRTWTRELETHLGCDYHVAVWNSTPNKAQRQAMERVLTDEGLTILVVNIEAMSAGTKARDLVRDVLMSRECYLAVDESQTIKSPHSKRTKKMLELGRHAAHRRIATGSPSPNSPMDLYSQLEFIVPGSTGQRSFYGFRARYAVLQQKHFGGRKVQVEVGYRNLDELQGMLARHSFRIRKDECLDLPEKIYTQREVDLTPEQERIYAQMRDEALAMIGGTFASSQAAITTLVRLQQIVCGYIRDDNGDLTWFDTNRVQALLDLAESTEEDMVIWVGQHRPMVQPIVDALERVYGEGAVAQFHGGNVRTRDDEAQRFVEDSSTRFMVSTQAAGARGNTWTNATQVVYFANTYNLEERVQSEDRCHRSGQSKHVTYTDLVAANTCDERLRKALVEKEKISAHLLGEDARTWM